jgi:hypothetical protein
MSYMELHIIDKDGNAVGRTKYKNSRGYDPRIWYALGQKYHIGSWYNDEDWDKLWALLENPNVPWFEKIALQTTDDYAIIRKEDIPAVIAALTKFEEENPPKYHVNHIPAIIKELVGLATEDILGVCFYPTSTIDNPWSTAGEDEDEEDAAYNIFKGTRHHFVPCRGYTIPNVGKKNEENN